MNKHFQNNETEYEIANSELHVCDNCGPSVLAETYYAFTGKCNHLGKPISQRFLGARCIKCRKFSYVKDEAWRHGKQNEHFTWFNDDGSSSFGSRY